MNASMLSHILLSCLLLSVQADDCHVEQMIRYTKRLLGDNSLSCPCRQTAVSSCSCLPIPEPGYELTCFVEGTSHMLANNITTKFSQGVTERLNKTFQTLLDRNLCERLPRGDQCQYKTKGNVREFLKKILTTYQEMNKSSA